MKTRKDVLRPIRRLARKHCSSFHSGNKCHACPGEQVHCSFFREDGKYSEYLTEGKVRCLCFESHVLPLDPKLELIYMGKHPDGEHGQAIATCQQCSKSFTKQSNRQVFCSMCRDEQSRKATRERMRKKYWDDKTKNLTV